MVLIRNCSFMSKKRPGRKSKENKTSISRLYSNEEHDRDTIDFLKAIDWYKRKVNPNPSYKEIHDIILALGWRKVAKPERINNVYTDRDNNS